MITPRKFNKIEIVDDDLIVKSSFDSVKMEAEYRWLRNPLNIFPHPKVFYSKYDISTGISEYGMEYIHYQSLAEIYIKQINNEIHPDCSLMSSEKYKKLFEDIKNRIEINKTYSIPEKELQRFDNAPDIYRDKTLSRLAQTKYNDLSKRYYLGHTQLPSLFDIIEECSIKTSVEDISYIHGDLCFSNILVDPSERVFRYWTIDPRGIDSIGKLSCLGDWRYDIGKLAHSAIGHYDWIKANKFKLNHPFKGKGYILTFDYFDYSVMYNNVKNIFISVFGRKKIWWQIMINLFLSMIPLHNDNEFHQEAMFWNALELYREMKEMFG